MIARLRARTRKGDDSGSVTLELAILAPAFVLLLGLLVLAGRVEVARSAVQHAAQVAARDASLARTVEGAQRAAGHAVERELAAGEVECSPASFVLDGAGFAAPLGRPAVVEVEITCVVSIADLAIPGLPGQTVLSAGFVSPLDVHRARP